MRLLVSCIPYDQGKSGISVYTREVVRALLEQGHELALVTEPGVDPAEIAGRAVAGFQAPSWTRRALVSMVWHLVVLPLVIWRRRKEFDGFVICAANRRVCAWYPLATTATVHDLANFHIPGKYSRSRMFYLAHVLPFFAKRAQHLVAVSGATKADMLQFWHCRSDDVTVLYNGLVLRDSCLVPRDSSLGPCDESREALSTNHESRSTRHEAQGTRHEARKILYISRIEHPGKNHVRLIEAYGRLPEKVAKAHPLVLAGADWKDADAVHAAAEKSPYRDLIRFTGFVDDIEALWKDAGYYVFPSLFEGFGLSLIEAMDRGITCACSQNGSLGEIAGDVAITFDPYDVESIASALARLLGESEDERAARARRGFEHIKKYSWSDHASGIVKLLGGEA